MFNVKRGDFSGSVAVPPVSSLLGWSQVRSLWDGFNTCISKRNSMKFRGYFER